MDTPSLTKLDSPAWKRSPLIDPLTRGVHHLALNTDDMKKTIEFYVDVLGMPLQQVLKQIARGVIQGLHRGLHRTLKGCDVGNHMIGRQHQQQ